MLFKKPSLNNGISTIELIVTIAIFVMITTSILISYPQLSSQLALEKTTQDIASTLHETRMYGIGVKSFGEGVVRTKGGYGVHFEKVGTNPIKSYTLFSDTDEDKKYSETEKVSEFKINGTEMISDVCVLSGSDVTTGDDVCVSSGTCLSSGTITSADILFLRPAPAVYINGFSADLPAGFCASTCARAVIVIKSPRGNCKKVEAWTTGQVSIQAKITP